MPYSRSINSESKRVEPGIILNAYICIFYKISRKLRSTVLERGFANIGEPKIYPTWLKNAESGATFPRSGPRGLAHGAQNL